MVAYSREQWLTMQSEMRPRISAMEAEINRLQTAIKNAHSLIDSAMGDTDPQDLDHPLLRACQTLRAALDP